MTITDLRKLLIGILRKLEQGRRDAVELAIARRDIERLSAEVVDLQNQTPEAVRAPHLGLSPKDACPKRGFPSALAAKLANEKNAHRLRFYHCPDCSQWHATKRDYR